uniref:Uncharacterized protein n=1 Tax=Promethearchaeum syntrophicum TaxID=2594042 RepID=A0A5B9DFE3_9ARCH|nr:hypothetical protein DSAG12_03579 [Candidatus Prometheoarchaeum syntrophicum]
MMESSTEFNYDYVHQKLLYLLLIKGCSVVIRPFEYNAKFDGLFELLRVFYIIEEIDMNNITNPAHLEGYFSQYDDGEKKSILLLKNVSQESMNEVIKYPEILFLALEKDQSIDYSDFQQIAVFNKKTKKFSQVTPKSLIAANSLAYKWIKETLISRLKSDGIFEIKEYLSSIEEKVGDLFQILPGILKKDYHDFCKDLTTYEQKAICAMCEKYYNVKLPEYTKKTIKPRSLPKNPEKPAQEEKIEEKNLIIESKDQEKNEVSFQQEPRESKIIKNDKIIKTDAIHNEDQINEEIWGLLSNESMFNAFSFSLRDIKIPIGDTFSTPEKKYCYLRTHQWQTEIPIEFFQNLFLYYIREEIKSTNVTQSQIGQYLLDKHAQIIDICSMFASPEFKTMDLFQYAEDEIIRSYLKKEPIVSHILPVEKKPQSVSPKEFEKMFAHDSNSPEKKNFNDQYQKKLTALKKEYGERDINPELIQSLRIRTKDSQNKIFKLFQD